jgi:APA family basic amino acid/polyamine antiporter
VVAIPALFLKMDFFVDLTSVGTFFAFILVCGGVLYMDHTGITKQSRFKVPYVNGKYVIGLGLIAALYIMYRYSPEAFADWRDHSFLYIIEHKILDVMFWVTWLVLSIIGFKHNFSLLPVAGILVNMYLMSELGSSNWFIFLIWLIIGLVVYFAYGYRKSKLNELETTSEA